MSGSRGTPDFVRLAKKLGLDPISPPRDAKRSVAVRRFKKRVAIAGIAAFTATVAWTFVYDSETRTVFDAKREVSHVYLDVNSLDDIIAVSTVVFLTSTGSHTWSVPADFNNSDNTVECIGGGATGARANSGTVGGRGGGGGGYARKTNVALTPSGTVSYYVGAASADTWFGSTGTVLAKGASGATGGQAASCVGDVCYSGGDASSGRNYSGVSAICGSGGGAAGESGDGGNASSGSSAYSGSGGSGGPSGGGSGGAGVVTTGNGLSGSNGHNWDGSHGAGGGGSGGACYYSTDTGVNGGSGGYYGGGGGGAFRIGTYIGGISAGSGRQGLIVITYTPFTARPRARAFILG